VASVLGLAVSARAVQLAEVGHGEVRDGDGTGTVVLDNLVVGSEGTSTLDVGGGAGILGLDGEGILAHVGPPHVGQRAGATAVHTLNLVGANDNVACRLGRKGISVLVLGT
jgi:hypothetical protein